MFNQKVFTLLGMWLNGRVLPSKPRVHKTMVTSSHSATCIMMGESRSGRGGTLTQVNQTQKAKNVCSPSYVVFRSDIHHVHPQTSRHTLQCHIFHLMSFEGFIRFTILSPATIPTKESGCITEILRETYSDHSGLTLLQNSFIT
jgi:hypothetical protein